MSTHLNEEVDRLFVEAVPVRSIGEIAGLERGVVAVALDLLDDERAQALAAHPTLRGILQNGESHISDRGLESLSTLGELEVLDLEWSSRITDRGLVHLAKLPKLRYVELAFCWSITDDGVRALQAALPSCEISR